MCFPGPEDYREYVESYVFETRPDLLSYDHYPFLEGSDRPSFFENLLVFREVSREYEVPFLLIVQLMPHADYRDVTDAELAWQVFHAIAFGARGISYFAYWTPTQVPDNIAYRFRKGIIEGGLPTEHYSRVAALNRRDPRDCRRARWLRIDRPVGFASGVRRQPPPRAHRRDRVGRAGRGQVRSSRRKPRRTARQSRLPHRGRGRRAPSGARSAAGLRSDNRLVVDARDLAQDPTGRGQANPVATASTKRGPRRRRLIPCHPAPLPCPFAQRRVQA